MKQVVYKYPVNPDFNGRSQIEMPLGAQILSVQTQRNEPQMWALVNPTAEKMTRFFYVAGTGEHIDTTDFVYIGTFQLHSGSLVSHLFEDKGL